MANRLVRPFVVNNLGKLSNEIVSAIGGKVLRVQVDTTTNRAMFTDFFTGQQLLYTTPGKWTSISDMRYELKTDDYVYKLTCLLNMSEIFTSTPEDDAEDRHLVDLEELKHINKNMKDMTMSIECVEGTLKSVDRRLGKLDAIDECLRSSGVTVSKDIPPISADEADVANLVMYAHKIIDQLGYGTRDLIRKRTALENVEKGNANEQAAMDKKLRESHTAGMLDVIKRLIDKYDGIDSIRHSKDNSVHVIWSLLMDIGVEIDGNGRFKQGANVIIDDEDLPRMQGIYTKIGESGLYTVTKTGLVFAGKIVCKAEFKCIDTKAH